MNANELADEVVSINDAIESEYNRFKELDEAATMLRQQQAEIEALKKDNKELHAIAQRMAMAESDARKSLQWFKDARERQSEPVAWMDYKGYLLDSEDVENYQKEGLVCIPLYTHPADESFDRTASHMAGEYVSYPAKTLTDKEIAQIWEENTPIGGSCHIKDVVFPFARAILRKASE